MGARGGVAVWGAAWVLACAGGSTTPPTAPVAAPPEAAPAVGTPPEAAAVDPSEPPAYTLQPGQWIHEGLVYAADGTIWACEDGGNACLGPPARYDEGGMLDVETQWAAVVQVDGVWRRWAGCAGEATATFASGEAPTLTLTEGAPTVYAIAEITGEEPRVVLADGRGALTLTSDGNPKGAWAWTAEAPLTFGAAEGAATRRYGPTVWTDGLTVYTDCPAGAP